MSQAAENLQIADVDSYMHELGRRARVAARALAAAETRAKNAALEAIAAHCSGPSGSPCTRAPATMATIGTFTNSVVIDADQVDPILPNNDDEVPVSAGEPQIVPSEVPGLGTGPSWLLALLILLAAGWHTRERR